MMLFTMLCVVAIVVIAIAVVVILNVIGEAK